MADQPVWKAAVWLGKRGYDVTITDSHQELGGRVITESSLPGLAEWRRVVDWRLTQIGRLGNVQVYPASTLDRDQIIEFAPDRVVLATGARWRRDGVGRSHSSPIPGWEGDSVLTPDDIMAGATPSGPVVVYDDDHYYMGSLMAEVLRRSGAEVTLVTPANQISGWTTLTVEQSRIQGRLLGLGVSMETGTALAGVAADSVTLECVHTGRLREIEAGAVVMTTSRRPSDELYHSVADLGRVDRIGDCLAPGTIATAVYSGHRYARELDTEPSEVPFRRE